jgi:hypothetical protein
MKTLKYILSVLAVTGALAISAKADLMFMGAINFNNGPNSPADNRQTFINTFGFDPGVLSSNFEGGSSLSGPVTVTPGEFFVVHYGKGKGGTGDGGSFEFFQVVNGETSVTFPQLGNGPTNPDPFGHGGISSARGFGGPPTTPDSGTTAALLGLGLTSLAGLRARFGRK